MFPPLRYKISSYEVCKQIAKTRLQKSLLKEIKSRNGMSADEIYKFLSEKAKISDARVLTLLGALEVNGCLSKEEIKLESELKTYLSDLLYSAPPHKKPPKSNAKLLNDLNALFVQILARYDKEFLAPILENKRIADKILLAWYSKLRERFGPKDSLKFLSIGLLPGIIDRYKLSDSDCKKLAIRHPRTWRNVLEEIKLIRKENPDLSDYDCKQLAIRYYKTWRGVLKEAKLIKKENPNLSDSDCKQLATGYPRTWRKVLEEAEKIKKENPDLSDYEYKKLAIYYYKTWRGVLKEAKLIKKENPDLSDYDCKQLAIGYYKTWRKLLEEAEKIKKENPDLSDYDCKQLAIGYYKTWRGVLKIFRKLEKKHPDWNHTKLLKESRRIFKKHP